MIKMEPNVWTILLLVMKHGFLTKYQEQSVTQCNCSIPIHPLNQRKQNTESVATMFWDRKSVLFVDFKPRGQTVNLEAYCHIHDHL